MADSTKPAGYRPFPSFAEWDSPPVDLSLWEQARSFLETLRESSPPEAVHAAASMVTRAAAVDTSAIEGFYDVDRGFTFSVATHAPTWQASFAEKGEHARSMFEAQLQAFELVLDLATKERPVTESLIRSLHEAVCAAQETYKVWTAVGWQEHSLERGAYKRYPNNPQRADGTEHAYAPVNEVGPEMARLVRELQTDAFQHASAPVQAAYAHYALVCVHPFADGNGRVARALASVYLVRAASIPLLIFADQKPRYLDALAEADNGGYAAFSAFVRERSIDAINLLSNGLHRAQLPPVEQLRGEAIRLHFATPELTHDQVDALAERLLQEAASQARSVFERLALQKQLSLSTTVGQGDSSGPPAGYRRLGRAEPPRLELVVKSAGPAHAEVSAIIRPLVARNDHPHPVRLHEMNRNLSLDVRTADLTPEISAVVHFRLQTWLETLLLVMVQKAIADGRNSLEKSGWNG